MINDNTKEKKNKLLFVLAIFNISIFAENNAYMREIMNSKTQHNIAERIYPSSRFIARFNSDKFYGFIMYSVDFRLN